MMPDWLVTIDHALFRTVNGAGHPVLDRIVPLFHRSLPLVLTATAVAAVVYWKFAGERGRRTLRLAALAMALSFVLGSLVLKSAVGRDRPPVALGISTRVEGGASGSSFPSGHSAVGFAFAVVVALRHPRWGWTAFPGALFIVWSRLYLGVHFPTDCLAGMLLGSAVAGALVFAARRRPESQPRPVPS